MGVGKIQGRIQTSVLQSVVCGSLLHLNHLLLKMQIPGVCFSPESETSQVVLMNGLVCKSHEGVESLQGY